MNKLDNEITHIKETTYLLDKQDYEQSMVHQGCAIFKGTRRKRMTGLDHLKHFSLRSSSTPVLGSKCVSFLNADCNTTDTSSSSWDRSSKHKMKHFQMSQTRESRKFMH